MNGGRYRVESGHPVSAQYPSRWANFDQNAVQQIAVFF